MRIKTYVLTLLFGAALVGCATQSPPPAPKSSAAPAPAPVESPPTPAAVRNMISNCFSCHGTDGRSPGAIPSLTGKTPEQVLAMLKGFKSGELPSTVMGRHAKGYSDVQLEALANYIGTNLK